MKIFILILFLLFIISSVLFSELFIYKSLTGKLYLTNSLTKNNVGRFKENYNRYRLIDGEIDETTGLPVFNEDMYSLPYASEKATGIDSDEDNKYDSIINKYAKIYFIDFELIKAIIKTESNFNEKYESLEGRKGLMLINEEIYFKITDEKITEDTKIFNPEINISVGVEYLFNLYNKYPTLELALAAYCSSEKIIDENNNIPEIRYINNFVTDVMENYVYYQHQYSAGSSIRIQKKNGRLFLINR